ncbi:hypothetical protein MSG28_011130 [Choristoneura fumiferana]|uniref:Uncharacterized protein n=1 Tax=Choristoneura fumiferana TaxID=7141 RepID=A0ACC0KR14_CHOFU|nr:hypothetical protein MSG28_011130 [Choristoneura fumiferana]
MNLFFVGAALLALACQVGAEKEKFLYFAYGSNLLHKRIQIQNPTAEFFSSAVLPDWRLDFNLQVKAWNGAVATVVPDHKSVTWGALWLIDLDQMAELDKQEGVPDGWYYATNVTVLQPKGGSFEARIYIETQNPSPPLRPGQTLPMDRRPSNTYLSVITFGAIESKLPKDYIKYLFTIPSNGKTASKEKLQELGHFYEIYPCLK